MKDKKNTTKIVVIAGAFILMFATILYFLLKDSYAIETDTSNLPASTAKLTLSCDGNTNISLFDIKKCKINLTLTDSNITEVSSVSAKISYSNLNGTIKEESYKELWQGATDGNKIDLYTAENKIDGALLLELEITPNTEAPAVAFVTLSDIIISDEKFDEFKLENTTLELNITDNNASLSSLSVENHSLSPAFNSETTNYSLKVDSKTETININAAAQSNNASIEGTGTKSLNPGVNTFEIIVTAEDGTTKKTYTIEVTREEQKDRLEFANDVIVDNENKYLTLILSKTDICNPDASREDEKMCYNVKDLVEKNKISTNGTITVTDREGNVIDEGNKITTGSKLNIKLKSGTSYDYTIIILGDTTGDGYIKLNDTTRLFQYYKEVVTMDEIYIKAGDVKNKAKGEIGLNDITMLFQYYRGTINTLNEEEL